MTWWLKGGDGIQPSRKFDFKVQFTVILENVSHKLSYRVKDITLPSLQKNIETVYMDGVPLKVEGTVSWQPIKISFYDADLIQADDNTESLATSLFYTAKALLKNSLDFGQDPTPEQLAKMNKLSLLNVSGRNIVFSQIDIYKYIGKNYVALGEGIAGPPQQARIAQQWTIFNPILTGVNFGELDYASEDTNLITIDLEYDSCILNKASII